MASPRHAHPASLPFAPRCMFVILQAESGLPCSWLDSFYAPVSGPGYSMPHEADIKAFLYQDCTPHPPCACAGLSFDGTDPGAHQWSAATACLLPSLMCTGSTPSTS